jgi:glucose/mannose transport system permease protein
MKRDNWERPVAILTLMPAILAIAWFVYYFIGYTFWVSLTNWRTAAPDLALRGFQNYQRLFTGLGIDTARFYIDLRNFFGFTALFLAGCLIIGFGLAVVIDHQIRFEAFFRSVFLLPMAISFIVTGVVWRWLLTPGTPELGSTGVNKLLEYIGLGFIKPRWFTDPTVFHIASDSGFGQFLASIGLGRLASPNIGLSVGVISICLAATWQLSGYVMALYLAGLRSVPDELREAARVDGASEFQIYRHVILPLMTPITLSAVVLLTHISLKIYDLVVSMTGVGPGFSTDTLAYNMFETTFKSSHFAAGAAIGIILLVLVAVIIVPYLRWSLRQEIKV